jgi:hypothetical protein
LQEVIRQLEPHPFVTAYLEWAGLNTLLTKYYNDAYIGAVQGPDPQNGRYAVYGRVHTVSADAMHIKLMCRCKECTRCFLAADGGNAEVRSREGKRLLQLYLYI